MSSPFANDQQFQRLLAGESEVDLIDLLLEFAGDAYPAARSGCSSLEARTFGDPHPSGRRAAGQRRGPGTQLKTVSRVLYEEAGFRGNREDYYDPRNSYLNEVLERRLGIPISLGIVYMAVATVVRLEGVRRRHAGPFYAGSPSCRRARCTSILSSGAKCSRPKTAGIASSGDWAGLSCRKISSTRASSANRGPRAAQSQGGLCDARPMGTGLADAARLAMLLPEMSDEQRDLGLVYLRTGHPSEALELLRRVSESVPGRRRPDAGLPTFAPARRMLAERN